MNPFEQWFNYPQTTLRALSEFGITVHWIILQYSIGMFTLVVLLEILARWRKNNNYLQLAKNLSRVAIVIFAVGAATGTMSEFGLLLFWPNFLNLVGHYFFAPFYLELLAFFAEVVFVYLYYYSWKKVGPKFHIFLGVMAASGLIMSGLMIVSANTMMSYPPGLQETYDPTTGVVSTPTFKFIAPNGTVLVMDSYEFRNIMHNDPEQADAIIGATLKDRGVLWMVFQAPGAIAAFFHAILAAILTSLMTIFGVYSVRYLKVKEERKEYYKNGLYILTILGIIFFVLQGLVGHEVAGNMARYSPEKLAAMEGTSDKFFGLEDIPIIGVLMRYVVNFLAYGKFTGVQLPNYDTIDPNFQAPIVIHYIYYTKIGLASLLFLNLLIYFYFFYKNKELPKLLLKLNYASPVLIQLVSNFGWMVREIGRKPWTVYGIMTVDEAARTGPLSGWLIAGIVLYILTLSLGLLALIYYLFRLKDDDLANVFPEDTDKEDEK